MLASRRPPNINANPPPLSSTFSYSSTMPLQPQSTLKRKRPVQTSYRSETTVDSTGQLREVIVIDDDSPTPQPTQGTLSATPGTHSASAAMSSMYTNGVRTRAQVAAEASGSGSRVPVSAPVAKRRKKDPGPVATSSTAQAVTTSTGSALRRKALAGKAYEPTPTQPSYPAGTNGGYKNGSTTLRQVRGSSFCAPIKFLILNHVVERIPGIHKARPTDLR